MKLLSLELKNFRQHQHTVIQFPPEGLIGILGPNESGKSSAIEAIDWAFHGADAIRGKVSSIRWHGATGRQIAKVILRWEIGGKTYRIQRTENDAKLWDESLPQPIAASISGVNSKVPQLNGMTREEWRATHLCLQKDLGVIASMGGVDREKFVLELMGVGRVDLGLQHCRKRKNKIATEIQGVKEGLGDRDPLEADLESADQHRSNSDTQLESSKESEAAAEKSYQDVKIRLDESSAKQTQHRELEVKRSQAGQQVEAADHEINRLEVERIKAAGAIEIISKADEQLKELPIFQEERDAIREAKARKSERELLSRQIGEDVKRHTESNSQLKELLEVVKGAPEHREVASLTEQHQAKVDDLREKKGKREGDYRDFSQEAHSYNGQAERLTKSIAAIEEAGEGGECPTCRRVLGEHFQEVLQGLKGKNSDAADQAVKHLKSAEELQAPSDTEMELQAQIDELAAKLETYRKAGEKADDAVTEMKKLQSSVDELATKIEQDKTKLSEMPQVEYSEERLQEVETRIQQLNSLNERVADDRVLAGRIDSIQEDITRWEQQGKTATEEISQIAQQITDLGFDSEAHGRIFTDTEAANKVLSDTRAELARAEEALKASRERYTRAEAALQNWDQRAGKLTDLQEELRIHTQAAERLADFRTAVASSIRPELEELTSAFVDVLTDGRHESITLADDFTVVLQESGSDMEVVSGGCEDIASIALRLAISQMIARRAGHPLSLLVMDEPFGSLDYVRRGNVLDLFTRLRETFQQVLVVTHVDEVKDTVEYVIQIEFDESKGRCNVSFNYEIETANTEEEPETEVAVEAA